MGMNITEKILANHCGKSKVTPGEIINARVDLAMANELSAQLAIKEFDDWGMTKLFDSNKVALIPDHFTPNKDITSANIAKKVREFAWKHNIKFYIEQGRAGIEHAVMAERGMILPGEVLVGGDSHTSTCGAMGCFATGVGSSDIAYAWALGEIWLKVPYSMKLNLKGKLKPWVSGKDIILHIIKDISVDGATYMAMEFTGPGISQLNMADRFTMANMSTEAGSKNGIFPVDDETLQYVKNTERYKLEKPEFKIYESDHDAEYESEKEYDMSGIEPQVACPFSPGNVKPLSDVEKLPIDAVIIGTCTNGWIEDMRRAAAVFKGHKVHPKVRVIVIPGSTWIQKQAIQEGLAEIFIESGCIFSTSTCGPCIGGHMGVLAEKERCVSTTNRNFVGRMGHPTAEIYLTNPAVAAASAILGRIAGPDEL